MCIRTFNIYRFVFLSSLLITVFSCSGKPQAGQSPRFGNDNGSDYMPADGEISMRNTSGGNDTSSFCYGTSCDYQNADNPGYDPDYSATQVFWNYISDIIGIGDSDSSTDDPNHMMPSPHRETTVQERERWSKYSNDANNIVEEINEENVSLDSKFRASNDLLEQRSVLNQEVSSRSTAMNNKVRSFTSSASIQAISKLRQSVDTNIRNHDFNVDDIVNSLGKDLNVSDSSEFLTSYDSPEGKIVRDAYSYAQTAETFVNSIPAGSNARKVGEIFVQSGKDAIKLADSHYAAGNTGAGNEYIDVAYELFDLAIGFIPGVGLTQDTYTLLSGKNLVTGEKVESWERVVAGASIITLGYGSKIAKGAKALKGIITLGKSADEAKSLAKIVDKGVDLANSAKEIGLDVKKGIDRYGSAAIGSISDEAAKNALKGWGKSKEGFNQLFEHSVKHSKDLPDRLPSLERRSGLPSGSLSKVGSSDPKDVAHGLKNLDDLANNVIQNGSKKTDGARSQYWVAGKESSNKGIRVITYDGKKQSIGPMKKKDWEKQ